MATKQPTPAAPSDASDGPQSAPGAAGGGAVATRGVNALGVPVNWQEELMKEAKDEAARERPSVSKIGLRNGVMTYQGNEIQNNAMEIVIVASVSRNTFYPDKFNPNEIKNPSCFALAAGDEEPAAHENVPDENVGPRIDGDGDARSCENCQFQEWGSVKLVDKTASPTARGKACKEGRRLIVMPASALASEEAVLKAELAVLDLPVTSVKNYANFVNALAVSISVPPWAAVTLVSVQRDAKTQFQVKFTPLRVAPEEVLAALKKRKDDALRIALTPWDEVGLSAKNYEGTEQMQQRAKKF